MKTILVFLCLVLGAVVHVSGTDVPQIPPGESQARERLNSTPRHGEWVEVPVPGSDVELKAWIVYPERKDKAPVVIVIHEIYGLSDWIRGVCDQLAADGFIAVAPDLLTGKGKDGAGTDGFADRDAVTKAVRSLKDDEVTSGLNATRAFASKLPSAASKFATVGFCWGGTTSFRYATVQPDLAAAVVYYGTSPESGYERIKAPVLGLYGGNDSRVGATVPGAEAKMKELKKSYLPKTYDGAGHGFLRQQDGQDGANKKASEQAWVETIGFLRDNLK